MELNIQKYQALLTTVETGSFTKAAEVLNYSQSGVSRMIGDLEKAWKIELLERSRGGVSLTSDGLKLLPYIKSVVAESDKLQMQIDALTGLESGLIRVGTPSSLTSRWMQNIIANFQKEYPDIDYELVLGDYDEIESWILEGRIDCGFTRLPAQADLETVFLEQDRLLAVLHKEHPLAEVTEFPVAALANEPSLLLERRTLSEISDFLKSSDLELHAHLVTWDENAILSMVEDGLGISILPEQSLSDVSDNVIVKSLDVQAFRNIGLALKSQKSASLAVKRFMEYLKYR